MDSLTFAQIRNLQNQLPLDNMSRRDFSRSLNKAAGMPIAAQGDVNMFQEAVKNSSAWIDDKLTEYAQPAKNVLGDVGAKTFGLFGADEATGRQVGEESLRGLVDFAPMIVGSLIPGGIIPGAILSGGMAAANAYEKTDSAGHAALAGGLSAFAGPMAKVGGRMAMGVVGPTIGKTALGKAIGAVGGTEVTHQVGNRMATSLMAKGMGDRVASSIGATSLMGAASIFGTPMVDYMSGNGWRNPSKEDYLAEFFNPVNVLGLTDLVAPQHLKTTYGPEIAAATEGANFKAAGVEAETKVDLSKLDMDGSKLMGNNIGSIERVYNEELQKLKDITDDDERAKKSVLLQEARAEAYNHIYDEDLMVDTLFGRSVQETVAEDLSSPVTVEEAAEDGTPTTRPVTADEVLGSEWENLNDKKETQPKSEEPAFDVLDADPVKTSPLERPPTYDVESYIVEEKKAYLQLGMDETGIVRLKRLEHSPEPKSLDEAQTLVRDANVVREQLGLQLWDNFQMQRKWAQFVQEGDTMEVAAEKTLQAVKDDTVREVKEARKSTKVLTEFEQETKRRMDALTDEDRASTGHQIFKEAEGKLSARSKIRPLLSAAYLNWKAQNPGKTTPAQHDALRKVVQKIVDPKFRKEIAATKGSASAKTGRPRIELGSKPEHQEAMSWVAEKFEEAKTDPHLEAATKIYQRFATPENRDLGVIYVINAFKKWDKLRKGGKLMRGKKGKDGPTETPAHELEVLESMLAGVSEKLKLDGYKDWQRVKATSGSKLNAIYKTEEAAGKQAEQLKAKHPGMDFKPIAWKKSGWVRTGEQWAIQYRMLRSHDGDIDSAATFEYIEAVTAIPDDLKSVDNQQALKVSVELTRKQMKEVEKAPAKVDGPGLGKVDLNNLVELKKRSRSYPAESWETFSKKKKPYGAWVYPDGRFTTVPTEDHVGQLTRMDPEFVESVRAEYNADDYDILVFAMSKLGLSYVSFDQGTPSYAIFNSNAKQISTINSLFDFLGFEAKNDTASHTSALRDLERLYPVKESMPVETSTSVIEVPLRPGQVRTKNGVADFQNGKWYETRADGKVVQLSYNPLTGEDDRIKVAKSYGIGDVYADSMESGDVEGAAKAAKAVAEQRKGKKLGTEQNDIKPLGAERLDKVREEDYSAPAQDSDGNEIEPSRFSLSEDTTRNMMVGKNSEMTIQMMTSLETARAMERNGADGESIRQLTGWFFGPDGKPRYEVNDRSMKLKKPVTGQHKLGTILHHPELFRLYPDLKELVVVIDPTLKDGAYFDPPADGYPAKIGMSVARAEQTPRETLAHEIQHYIQNKEGFLPGTNPDHARERLQVLKSTLRLLEQKNSFFTNVPGMNDQTNVAIARIKSEIEKYTKIRGGGYINVYGEGEAFSTSDRLDFSDSERKAVKPLDTRGLSESELITAYKLGPESTGPQFDALDLVDIERAQAETERVHSQVDAALVGDQIYYGEHLTKTEKMWKIEHELGHFIYRDKAARKHFDRLWESLSPEEQESIETVTKSLYDDRLVQEENHVRALELIRRKAASKPAWKRFVSAVREMWRKATGQEPADAEALAARMVAVARKELFVMRKMQPKMAKNMEDFRVKSDTENPYDVPVRLSASSRLKDKDKLSKSDIKFIEQNQVFVDKYDSQSPDHKRHNIQDVAAGFVKSHRERSVQPEVQLGPEYSKALRELREDQMDTVVEFFDTHPEYTKTEAAMIVSLMGKRAIIWKAETELADGTTIKGQVKEYNIDPKFEGPLAMWNDMIAANTIDYIREGMRPDKAMVQALKDVYADSVGGRKTENRGWQHYKAGEESEAHRMETDVSGCSGGWCTGSGSARGFIVSNKMDFWVYFDEEGRARVSINAFPDANVPWQTTRQVSEVRGSYGDQDLRPAEMILAKSKLEELQLDGADKVMNDIAKMKSWRKFEQTGKLTDVRLFTVDAEGKFVFDAQRENYHRQLGVGEPLFTPTQAQIDQLAAMKFADVKGLLDTMEPEEVYKHYMENDDVGNNPLADEIKDYIFFDRDYKSISSVHDIPFWIGSGTDRIAGWVLDEYLDAAANEHDHSRPPQKSATRLSQLWLGSLLGSDRLSAKDRKRLLDHVETNMLDSFTIEQAEALASNGSWTKPGHQYNYGRYYKLNDIPESELVANYDQVLRILDQSFAFKHEMKADTVTKLMVNAPNEEMQLKLLDLYNPDEGGKDLSMPAWASPNILESRGSSYFRVLTTVELSQRVQQRMFDLAKEKSPNEVAYFAQRVLDSHLGGTSLRYIHYDTVDYAIRELRIKMENIQDDPSADMKFIISMLRTLKQFRSDKAQVGYPLYRALRDIEGLGDPSSKNWIGELSSLLSMSMNGYEYSLIKSPEFTKEQYDDLLANSVGADTKSRLTQSKYAVDGLRQIIELLTHNATNPREGTYEVRIGRLLSDPKAQQLPTEIVRHIYNKAKFDRINIAIIQDEAEMTRILRDIENVEWHYKSWEADRVLNHIDIPVAVERLIDEHYHSLQVADQAILTSPASIFNHEYKAATYKLEQLLRGRTNGFTPNQFLEASRQITEGILKATKNTPDYIRYSVLAQHLGWEANEYDMAIPRKVSEEQATTPTGWDQVDAGTDDGEYAQLNFDGNFSADPNFKPAQTPEALIEGILLEKGVGKEAVDAAKGDIVKLFDMMGLDPDTVELGQKLVDDVRGSATIKGPIARMILSGKGLGEGLSDQQKVDALNFVAGHEIAHLVERLHNEGLLSDRHSDDFQEFVDWLDNGTREDHMLARELMLEMMPKRMRSDDVTRETMGAVGNGKEMRANLLSAWAVGHLNPTDQVLMNIMPRGMRKGMQVLGDLARSIYGAMKGTGSILQNFKNRSIARARIDKMVTMATRFKEGVGKAVEWEAEAQKIGSWGGQVDQSYFANFDYVSPEDPRTMAGKAFDALIQQGDQLARTVPTFGGVWAALHNFGGATKASIKRTIGAIIGGQDAAGRPVFETHEAKLEFEMVRDKPKLNRLVSDWMLKQNSFPVKHEDGSRTQGKVITLDTLAADAPKLWTRLQALPKNEQNAVVSMVHRMREGHKQFALQEVERVVDSGNKAIMRAFIAQKLPHLWKEAPGLADQLYQAVRMMNTSADPVGVQQGQMIMGQVAAALGPEVFQATIDIARNAHNELGKLNVYLATHGHFSSEIRTGKYFLHWKESDGTTGGLAFEDEKTMRAYEDKLRAPGRGATVLNVEVTRRGQPHMAKEDAITKVLAIHDETNKRIIEGLGLGEELTKQLQSMFDYRLQFGKELKAQEIVSPGSWRKLKPGREELDMVQTQFAYFNAATRALHKKILFNELQYQFANPEMKQPLVAARVPQMMKMVENFMAPDTELGSNIVMGQAAYFLGANWSSHLVELAQPAFSMLPEMASRGLGTVESTLMLAKAQAAVLKFTQKHTPSMIKRFFGDKLGQPKDFGVDNNDLWANPEHRALMKHAVEQDWISLAHASEALDMDLSSNIDLSGVMGRNGEKSQKTMLQKALTPVKLYAKWSLKIYQQFTEFNTRVALITGYEIARKNGMTPEQAIQYANEFKNVTTYSGGKANRPQAMFSGREGFRTLGQAAYSLQGYQFGVLSMLRRYAETGYSKKQYPGLTNADREGARKALKTMLTVQALGAGAIGLPFAGAAMKLLEGMTGFEAEKELREALADLFQEDEDEDGGLLTDMVMHGAANLITRQLPGSPDIGSRFALGGVMGLNSYDGYSLSALAGPSGAVVEAVAKGAGTALRDQNLGQAFQDIAPPSWKKLIEMTRNRGEFRDRSGGLLVDGTFGEKLAYGIGFAPQRVKNAKNYERLQRGHEEHLRDREIRKFDQLAELYKKDPVKAQEELLKIAKADPKVKFLQEQGDYQGAQQYLHKALQDGMSKLAERIDKATFAKDPRRNGTFKGTSGSDSLLNAMGMGGRVSELERLNTKAQVYAQMGMEPPVNQKSMAKAQMMDQIMTQNPSMPRPQASLLADQALARNPLVRQAAGLR